MPFVYYCLLRFQSEGFFLPIAFLRFHSVGMPFAYCVATVSELENAFCLLHCYGFRVWESLLPFAVLRFLSD